VPPPRRTLPDRSCAAPRMMRATGSLVAFFTIASYLAACFPSGIQPSTLSARVRGEGANMRK
jgi:hypothetical protein